MIYFTKLFPDYFQLMGKKIGQPVRLPENLVVRLRIIIKSIIVDNEIVQEIDGYSGEEYFLSIMGKTDPISK